MVYLWLSNNMVNLVRFLDTVVFFYTLRCVYGNMDGGPGVWHVYSVEDCSDEVSQVLFNLTVNKHKLNRTHDVYDVDLDVTDTVGDGDSILIDICKHTDGGCKQVQVVTDDNMGNFAEKYAKNNMETAFSMAGMDPPRFPVQEGKYSVRDFYFDRCEMPTDAVYGEFTGTAYAVRAGARVACVRAHVEFRNDDDAECAAAD